MTPPRHDRRAKLEVHAKLIDLGHAVDEPTVNRVLHRLRPEEHRDEAALARAVSDEQARQAIQRSYG